MFYYFNNVRCAITPKLLLFFFLFNFSTICYAHEHMLAALKLLREPSS